MPEPIVAFWQVLVAYWEALSAWITIWLAVLAALLLLGIAVYGWVWWPRRVVARLWLDDPKARADVEDNFRKTVGQALGGAVVLLGAGLAYWQFRQQQQTSSSQFSEQQRATHDLLISNQVSKGFEQLGSEKVVIRLGGIYALEGVMNGSDQYHRAVLEALSAFVREGAKLPTTPPTPGTPTQGLPTDIQAALTVIRRRSAGLGIVDLNNTSIAGAIMRGANLNHADLRAVDLNHADLSSSDLTGASLDLANLFSANLFSADLTSAQVAVANLAGANLGRASLGGANLSYTSLTGAILDNANLTGALLADANLTGAALARANLTGAVLAGADLTGADLRGANLANANLTNANLTRTSLDGQKQLDEACGSDAVLPTGLTLKPCPPRSP
jgi:uncharacterized protein YjbI with pentapeptide repeats